MTNCRTRCGVPSAKNNVPSSISPRQLPRCSGQWAQPIKKIKLVPIIVNLSDSFDIDRIL